MKALRLIRYTLAIAILSVILAAQALATCFLRQSDAAEVPIGQFVDATDGVTAETGLTISQADVMLKKCAAGGDCGAMAQKNDSSACAHDALGVYECDLNATDTDTVGTLFIYVNESGALTEKLVCQVLDTAPFDADYADAATGLRQANIASVTDGALVAADFAADFITAAKIASDVSTEFSAAVFTVNATQISGDSNAADELELAFDGATGAVESLGIARQGTAQSATGTTLVLDASSPFADDAAIGMTLVACGSTQGYCQAQTVTDYVNATDTATVAGWTVTPSGTITFYLFATAPGSAGSLTANDVWTHASRTLTALDEDSTTLDLNATTVGGIAVLDEDTTTIDLNASFVGGVTVFDEDSTTIDINATTLGTVTTLTNLPAITANWLTAAGTAADFSTEVNTGMATQASVDTIDDYVDTEVAAILDDTGTSGVQLPAGEITSSTFGAGAIDAAALSADAGTELATAFASSQLLLTGTCDSGSTTTCVDNALTQAATSQLDDRMICFDDSWCALITDFTPGTDTVTTTKTAPSTRASKAYVIFPSTAQ